MLIGDIVWHPKHGAGAVEGVEPARERVRARFLHGPASVRVTNLKLLVGRIEMMSALLSGSDLPDDLTYGALAYLRSNIEPMYTAAAQYIATRPSLPQLAIQLDVLGDLKSEPIRGRILAATQNWQLIPRLLRGTQRLPGESDADRVERINAQFVAAGMTGLNVGQIQRMYERYENHCWNCERGVSSESSVPCPECFWWLCYCGACRSPQYGGCSRA